MISFNPHKISHQGTAEANSGAQGEMKSCMRAGPWLALSIFLWPLQTVSSSNGPVVSELSTCCLDYLNSSLFQKGLLAFPAFATLKWLNVFSPFTRMSHGKAGTASILFSTVALHPGRYQALEWVSVEWMVGQEDLKKKGQFCPGKAEPVVKFHSLIKHPCCLQKTVLNTYSFM